MDPFSAISLAASLVAFLDFGGKLLSVTLRAYKSPSGNESRDVELSAIAKDLQHLTAQAERRLEELQRGNRTLSPSEEKLSSLCRDCQAAASQLLEALNDLKSKGSLRVDFPSLNGFLTALRRAWSSNKIVALEERLVEIRQQIVVAALVCVWEEAKISGQQNLLVRERLERILSTVSNVDKTTTSFAEELAHIPTGGSEDMKKARKNVIEALGEPDKPFGMERDASITPDGVTEHPQSRSIQHIILDNLNFQGINNREDAIPGAYQATFEWIFRKTEVSNNAESRDLASFTSWLEKDTNDVFWITGKPGSGKSTLMKYIGHHPSLLKSLNIWADGLPLLCASFYFWSAGNDLQKSLEGLWRTILHQGLSAHPELISKVAPRRWWILRILGTNVTFPGWTLQEIKKCFHALAAENGKSLRLALFIDGLDEFSGDHKSITEFIGQLSNECRVKFCVTSRPWNVFADAFRQYPSIKMQDLTKKDIEVFIQKQFENSQGFQELRTVFPQETDKILEELGLKAEGVFLWVNLVVRSLLEMLREDPRLSLIRQTLSDLPTDLELLYNAIWRSIDDSKIGNSSKLFQLAMTLDVGADGQPGHPTCDAVTIWLAFEADTPNQISRPLTADAEQGVRQLMTRILSSNTRGILEVSPMGRVNFLHRTARDWIQKPDEWNQVRSKSPSGFECNLMATKALALEMTRRESRIPANLQDFSAGICQILCYAGEVGDSDANTPKLVEVLDRLDMEVVTIANNMSYPQGHCLSGKQPNFVPVVGYSPAHWSSILYNRNETLSCSLLDLACLFAVLPYVKAKVSSDPFLLRSKNKAARLPLVGTAALGEYQTGLGMTRLSWYLMTVPYSRRLETVRFLLENGANPKHISGGQELANGDVHQFLAQRSKGRQVQQKEMQYWDGLAALLHQHWGPFRSLKGRLLRSSWGGSQHT